MATQRGNGNGHVEHHPEIEEADEMIDEEFIEEVVER